MYFVIRIIDSTRILKRSPVSIDNNYCTCKIMTVITKTRLLKLRKNHHPKTEFSDKNSDIFHISAQKHRLWVLTESVLTSTYKLCFYTR